MHLLTFQTSKNEDYQRFYQRMMEFAEHDPDVLSESFYTLSLAKLLEGNYVHLVSASTYQLIQSDHCELTPIQERLLQDTLAVHLQKGYPYTQMFNHV